MKYAVFADIHSNLEALEAVIEAYKSEHIEEYYCAGDLVGYGASPNECIERLQEIGINTVAGNHDWAVAGLIDIDNFNFEAQKAVLWTRKALSPDKMAFIKDLGLVRPTQDFTLVHGSLDDPQEFHYLTEGYPVSRSFKLLDRNVCFVGHSHVAGIFIKIQDGSIDYTVKDSVLLQKGRKYIVNVGSVGQPRDGDPRAAYCVFDTDERRIEIKRAAYDIRAAGKRIIDAGLPEFLANRLMKGL